MIRSLITAASAFSLLLCVATVTLWIRSYWVDESVHWARNAEDGDTAAGQLGYFGIESVIGKVCIEASTHCQFLDFDFVGWHYYTTPSRYEIVPETTGNSAVFESSPPVYRMYFQAGSFAFYRRDLNNSSPQRTLILPWWFPAVLTAILPAIWAGRRFRAGRLRAAGLCKVCGYDLRASTDRCPECGTPVSHDRN